MITNDYEPEELQFVLPEVVKDTFPLELTFGNAENEKEIIKAVNEHFNVMFPENELAMSIWIILKKTRSERSIVSS